MWGMKWVSNIYNPKRSDAKMYVVPFLHQTQEEAWEDQQEWLRDKVIGEPQAVTNGYSLNQLLAIHMVGVYVQDPEFPQEEPT